MKILIISPPRCGSTSLLDNLCKLTNSIRIFEPYSDTNQRIISDPFPYPLKLQKNCIVKMITYQVPESFGTPQEFPNLIKSVYLEYDKVIILNRKNLEDHFESYINLTIRPKKFVHVPWYYEDIKELKKDFNIKRIVEQREMADHISSILNIPIIYYEDLYGEDRKKSLNIIKSLNLNIDVNLLNENLNPKFRYRREKRDLL